VFAQPFRVSLLFALALPLLLLRAPSATAAGHTPPTNASVPGSAPTIVAIGDSITYGFYDTAVKGGWVTRLAAKLDAAYPRRPLVVRNAGIGGDTSQGVLTRLQRDVISVHPQMVIISIGTNDFNRGVPASVYARRLSTPKRPTMTSSAEPPPRMASAISTCSTSGSPWDPPTGIPCATTAFTPTPSATNSSPA